eukprot:403346344
MIILNTVASAIDAVMILIIIAIGSITALEEQTTNHFSHQQLCFGYIQHFIALLLVMLLGVSIMAIETIKFYKEDITLTTQLVIYVLLAFNFICLLMTSHLISFHIWLYKKDITTFEYIIFNREKREKDLELKTGQISIEEYRDWQIQSHPKKTKKKSKIILQVKNFGDETPDKDMSAMDIKQKDDLSDEKRFSLPKLPNSDLYDEKHKDTKAKINDEDCCIESARSTFNNIEQHHRGDAESVHNPILQYELGEDMLSKDCKSSNIQHLQTGLDNTKVDGNASNNGFPNSHYSNGKIQDQSANNLVAEKYSRGRFANCFTSVTCTPCIVKKPQISNNQRKHINMMSFNQITKGNGPAYYQESTSKFNHNGNNQDCHSFTSQKGLNNKQNEDFKLNMYDYEEQKNNDRYEGMTDQFYRLSGNKAAQMDFEVTDAVGGKVTQTGFYKQQTQLAKNVKFEHQRKKVDEANSLMKSNDGRILPLQSTGSGVFKNISYQNALQNPNTSSTPNMLNINQFDDPSSGKTITQGNFENDSDKNLFGPERYSSSPKYLKERATMDISSGTPSMIQDVQQQPNYQRVQVKGTGSNANISNNLSRVTFGQQDLMKFKKNEDSPYTKDINFKKLRLQHQPIIINKAQIRMM